MNFWETPDWIMLKTKQFKTKKILSRSEYVKEFGYKEYSEEKYGKYIKIMRKEKKIEERLDL